MIHLKFVLSILFLRFIHVIVCSCSPLVLTVTYYAVCTCSIIYSSSLVITWVVSNILLLLSHMIPDAQFFLRHISYSENNLALFSFVREHL